MHYKMIQSTLIFIAGGILSYYLSNKIFGKTKFCFKNKPEDGLIYLIDEDIDKKFTLKDLVNPTYSAFEKPFKTCADIKKVPHNIQIKLVISTKGGSCAGCEKIVKVLKQHPAGYSAYICGESYSAGAIIALGAKEIIMSKNSYIGKMDPQISDKSGYYSAINYYNLDKNYIDASNINRVKESLHTINYMNDLFEIILENHPSKDILNGIKEHFVFSEYPHAKLFDYDQCEKIGLHVRKSNEEENHIFSIFDNL